MEQPPELNLKRSQYWVRGPGAKRHRYFYPCDDKIGLALMLLVGILGLVALGMGLHRLLVAPLIQIRDVVLAAIGLMASILGLCQAYRLSGLEGPSA